MAYEYSRNHALWLPNWAIGSTTDTPAIDSAFSHGVSGDCYVCRFTSPVSQSAATLKFFIPIISVTGTPTFGLEVRDVASSGDYDRPDTGGSDLCSSPSSLSLSSADDNTWGELSCTVSLTAGESYFLLVKNTHGTPASNYATFRYRGAIDFGSECGSSFAFQTFITGYNTSGFTADPTLNTSGGGVGVLEFADGTVMGNPYAAVVSHASNTNSRGIRLTLNEDIVVSGICYAGTNSSQVSHVGIYSTGGSTVVESAISNYTSNKTVTVRFAPVTLTGGTAYDVCAKVSSSTTAGSHYNMLEAEGSVPASVLACRPFSIAGVSGTIGSFTPDTSRFTPMMLLVDNMPAISGGGTGQTSHCFIG